MSGVRKLHRSELIVVEGQTEENLVNAARVWARTGHIRAVVNAKGGPRLVTALTRTRTDAYTRVWIVLDAEAHPHRVIQKVLTWVASEHAPERFKVVVTAPAIEAWILAHYEGPAGTGAAMERRLSELTGYTKPTLPRHFPIERWAEAAGRLTALDLDIRPVPERSTCPLCQPGSAWVRLMPTLLGEDA